MDAVRASLRWFAAVGGSVLLVAGPASAQFRFRSSTPRPAPAPAVVQTAQPPLAAQPVQQVSQAQTAPAQQPAQQAERLSPAEKELQDLMQRLTKVGEELVKNIESPQSWQYQLQQADLLLQIASRSQQDCDNWLKMAIESHHSAAVSSPENDRTAWDRMVQLPAVLARHFPGSKWQAYAALMEVRAEHSRMLGKEGADQDKAKEHLRQRLLRFAQDHHAAPEAAKAVLEAAQISESMGKTADACASYRALAEAHAGKEVAREARAALRRLGGMNGEAISLTLPLLYPTSAQPGQSLDLKELQGKLVVLYFWTIDGPGGEGFDALKRVTDQYQFRGLEVVYVNMDGDMAKAQQYLSGKLTAGTHVLMKDGRKNAAAERYGLDRLPQVFLLGKDGGLLKHSLTPGQVEAAVAEQYRAARVGK